MRIISWTLLITALGTARNSENWVSLFNGTDLTNWSVRVKPADADREFWTVEDSAIVAYAADGNHDYVWLYSDGEYLNFRLNLKYQVRRGDFANSGIQLRSRYDEQAQYLNGLQVDIGSRGWCGTFYDETSGDKGWVNSVDLFSANGDTVTYVKSEPYFLWDDMGGGWNEMEILVEGLWTTVWLNGTKVSVYDGAGYLDNANHLAHGVGAVAGHIAMQLHVGSAMRISFKDIYILDLDAAVDVSKPPGAGEASQFSVRHTGSGVAIDLLNDGFSEASLLDRNGKTLYRATVKGSAAVWDGADPAPGVYIVRLGGNGISLSQMVFLTR